MSALASIRAPKHPRPPARTMHPPSMAERLLHALGADPGFVDSLLGDLAEESTLIASRDGEPAARWWYAREALRSAPYLLASAVRYLARHHRPRLAAYLAGIALTSTVAMIALFGGHGPPARLVTVTGSGTVVDGIVVNSVRPIRLAMRAFDADGHALPDTGVRYRWTSGVPLSVSPAGVITCTQPGDATIHASLGAAAASVPLHCRPVRDVRAPAMLDLVVGAPSQDIPFEAVGPDGRPVTLLAGQIAVGDSNIVTVEGQRMLALAPGSTWLTVHVGDHASFTSVHVYERVTTPEAVRQGQHVAVPIRLASGEMRQWRIPAGEYFVAILPESGQLARPRLAVVGASCISTLGHLMCSARSETSVIAYFPQDADRTRVLSGSLVVWRQQDP